MLNLFNEIRYAIKSFFSVFSGFVRIETKHGDTWEQAEEKIDDSFYVCAVFKNSRHIPLPILADWDNNNKIQKFAMRLAGLFNPESYRTAKRLCEDWVEPNSDNPLANVIRYDA
jgi:hypothetical protein